MNTNLIKMVMISDYDSDSDCKDVGSDDNEEGDKKLWWEDNMIIFFLSIYYKKWVWLCLYLGKSSKKIR